MSNVRTMKPCDIAVRVMATGETGRTIARWSDDGTYLIRLDSGATVDNVTDSEIVFLPGDDGGES